MEILSILQVGLYLPFFGVLAFFCLIYLRKGYKRDFGCSLVSLIATIISIIMGLLWAKRVSPILSALLVSFLPSDITEELSAFGTLGTSLAQVAIEIVLSFVLFVMFFLISLAVFKKEGQNVTWSKLDKLNASTSGSRIAGMGIRGVDAILVSLMLLLPFYGTMAMIAPSAATLMRMEETFSEVQNMSDRFYSEEQVNATYNQYENEGMSFAAPKPNDTIVPSFLGTDFALEPVTGPDVDYSDGYGSGYDVEEDVAGMDVEPAEIFDMVANHPMLLPYKYGPGSWVYSGLSSFSMNGKKVDVSAAFASLEGLINRVEACFVAVEQENEAGAVAAIDELVDYTRENVIYQQWSYDIVMAFVAEIDAIVESDNEIFAGEEDVLNLYEQARPFFDMTFDEYTNNAEAILDFVAWLVESYGELIKGEFSEEDYKIFKNDMYARLGDLLNHSEQIVGLKRILLQVRAQRLFDTLPDPENPEYADYYAARQDVPNTAEEFVNKYFGDGIVPEEKRAAEGSVFMLTLGSSHVFEVAELFVRHPMFGADAVLEAMDEYMYINFGDENLGEALSLSENKSAICQELDDMLRACENVPLDQPMNFFSDAINRLFDVLDEFYSDDSSPLFNGYFKLVKGLDNKLYIIPKEYEDELSGYNFVDEHTIYEYNLQEATDSAIKEALVNSFYSQSEINDFSGSFDVVEQDGQIMVSAIN